jgi:hypothetical protein
MREGTDGLGLFLYFAVSRVNRNRRRASVVKARDTLLAETGGRRGLRQRDRGWSGGEALRKGPACGSGLVRRPGVHVAVFSMVVGLLEESRIPAKVR